MAAVGESSEQPHGEGDNKWMGLAGSFGLVIPFNCAVYTALAFMLWIAVGLFSCQRLLLDTGHYTQRPCFD